MIRLIYNNFKLTGGIKLWKRKTNFDRSPFTFQIRMKGEGDSVSYLSNTQYFQEIYRSRKSEAKRSLLIQVPEKSCCNFVYSLCMKYGSIRKMFYTSHVKDYILIEFENLNSVPQLLSQVSHFKDTSKVLYESRILYFARPNSLKETIPVTVPIEFESSVGCDFMQLQHSSSIAAQMKLYYQSERQTEIGKRLQYFLCSVLEDSLKSLFPHVEVIPFGSMACGLARHNSDLDVILSLGEHSDSDKTTSSDSYLRFMTRKIPNDDAQSSVKFSRKALDVISNIIQVFQPHYGNVQRILNARVPIINFHHESTNISCDLSLKSCNSSGVVMSELIYSLCQIDSRFRTLVFVLRKWASVNGLTINIPGPRFSNFMLTSMVIFFLQSRDVPVLPPLKHFIKDGEIIQDRSKMVKSKNEQDLGEMLLEFFEFYSSFNFHNNAISLLEGTSYKKPERMFRGELFMENPLDTSHNITRNVKLNELQHIQACMQTANLQLRNMRQPNNHPWGIINILQSAGTNKHLKLGVQAKDIFALDKR